MNLDCIVEDVTIDACILAHATAQDFAFGDRAMEFFELLRSSKLKWVLDDNGKAAPALETSLMYAEYHQTVGVQAFPLLILYDFLANERVVFSPRPDQALRKHVKDHVSTNKRDQVVLAAAVPSAGKVIVSDDYDDFTPGVRAEVLACCGVRVVCCLDPWLG